MRLIDADDLKEDMKSRLSYCNEWIEKAKDKETKIRASAVKSFIAEVIMTIDNAPTVEPEVYITGEDYDLYMRGYNQARKDIIHSIAKQYSEHNELVPVWLNIGDMRGKEE